MDALDSRGGIVKPGAAAFITGNSDRLPCEAPVGFPDQWSQYELLAPVNAFCVTLYNERRAAVEATIRSVTAAANHCYQEDPSLYHPSVLCLIADGRPAVDPELLLCLQSLGMLSATPVRLGTTELHFRAHQSSSRLLQLACAAESTNNSLADRFHTIVCLKDSNLGKLNSHALFFGTLCGHMQPRFCFQIDAGTTLAPDVVSKLVKRLQDRPELAAVAPRVMPAVPRADDGFLAHWQYADFAMRKGILWPFELATGHLSVIPGQICVFRWEALQAVHKEGAEQACSGPLNGYLRGGEALGCLGRIMYLAEDRVIGNQIVLAPGSRWKLGYAPEATAETDSCNSPVELLRQRRRWNNSAMATRWWLLQQLPGTLRRRDRSAAQNRDFALAVCSQAVLAAREFLLPAQLVATLTVLLQGSSSPAVAFSETASGSWLVALAAWVLIEFLAVGRFRPMPEHAMGRARRILGSASTGLFVITILLILPLSCSLVLLAPVLALPGMSLVLPRSGLLSTAHARLFHLPHLAIATALSCYSFWNLHDASWGTKGLKTATASAACVSQLRRWRNQILFVWLVSNGSAATVAVTLHGFVSPQLNPVAELFAILDLLLAAVALWHLVGDQLLHRSPKEAHGDLRWTD
jgi:chitin synthase